MARCELWQYSVPLNNSPFGSVGRVVTMCKTHDMEVPQPQGTNLCPIGRIEEATDQALDRIREVPLEAALGATPPAK